MAEGFTDEGRNFERTIRECKLGGDVRKRETECKVGSARFISFFYGSEFTQVGWFRFIWRRMCVIEMILN